MADLERAVAKRGALCTQVRVRAGRWGWDRGAVLWAMAMAGASGASGCGSVGGSPRLSPGAAARTNPRTAGAPCRSRHPRASACRSRRRRRPGARRPSWARRWRRRSGRGARRRRGWQRCRATWRRRRCAGGGRAPLAARGGPPAESCATLASTRACRGVEYASRLTVAAAATPVPWLQDAVAAAQQQCAALQREEAGARGQLEALGREKYKVRGRGGQAGRATRGLGVCSATCTALAPCCSTGGPRPALAGAGGHHAAAAGGAAAGGHGGGAVQAGCARGAGPG